MATFSIRTLLAASFIALNGAAVAQEMPKITLNVVGNLGITTQSKELEAPMEASNSNGLGRCDYSHVQALE